MAHIKDITEIVNTHELNNGDVVICHGGVFRLKNCEYWDNGHSACVSFDSDFLGDMDYEEPCMIPASWRHGERGWLVQGNELATWVRVLPTDENNDIVRPSK